MVGRRRKHPADCVRRKASAPAGYSSIYAARAAKKAERESAAKLRALVEAHGTSVALEWSSDEMRAHLHVKGAAQVNLSRPLCRSWEARGWARLLSLGKGQARLEVDPDAIPGPDEGTSVAG